MPYAIGEVIYGLDLTQYNDERYNKKLGKKLALEVDRLANELMYNENDEFISRAYETEFNHFGIRMDEFDETEVVKLKDRKWDATDKIKSDYKEKLDAILVHAAVSDELKEYLRTTEPEVLIMWTSS